MIFASPVLTLHTNLTHKVHTLARSYFHAITYSLRKISAKTKRVEVKIMSVPSKPVNFEVNDGEKQKEIPLSSKLFESTYSNQSSLDASKSPSKLDVKQPTRDPSLPSLSITDHDSKPNPSKTPEHHKNGGFLTEIVHQAKLAGEGLVDGIALTPINAVTQIANKTIGSDIKKLEFSNQKEVDASTAGTIGKVVGSAVDFMAISAATGGLADAALGVGVTADIVSMGAAGAIQMGVLMPSDNNKTGAKFLLDRAENGLVSGTAMAVMGGVGGKVAGILGGSVGGDGALNMIAKEAAGYTVGGGAGGVVSAYGNAALKGRLATGPELKDQIVSGAEYGAMSGAAMAGVHSSFGSGAPMPMFMDMSGMNMSDKDMKDMDMSGMNMSNKDMKGMDMKGTH
jgi:hypothetical protein